MLGINPKVDLLQKRIRIGVVKWLSWWILPRALRWSGMGSEDATYYRDIVNIKPWYHAKTTIPKK
jgi:hypothetical protein